MQADLLAVAQDLQEHLVHLSRDHESENNEGQPND
jgi:hypothetical protein